MRLLALALLAAFAAGFTAGALLEANWPEED